MTINPKQTESDPCDHDEDECCPNCCQAPWNVHPEGCENEPA